MSLGCESFLRWNISRVALAFTLEPTTPGLPLAAVGQDAGVNRAVLEVGHPGETWALWSCSSALSRGCDRVVREHWQRLP